MTKIKWPVSTIAVIIIFVVFALGLVLQPERWAATPAYGNLLVLMSAPYWGLAYFSTAVVFTVSILSSQSRILALGAHLLAFILLLTWEVAFVVRWATDTKTTIVNVVSWGTYLALVVYSARHIDIIESDGEIEDDSITT